MFAEMIEGGYRPLKLRRIRLETCKLYSFRCAKIGEDYVTAADYHSASGVVAQHVKRLEDGYWYWIGRYSGARMFGQGLWPSGGKRLVITKGEVDCLTIAQAFGLKWPVVAIPGLEQAVWWVKQNLEWASSYQDVVLAFDDSELGKKATDEVGALFPPGRARVMTYRGYKDANDMLMENAGDQIANQVFNASQYRPDGIVMGDELWEDIKREPPEGLTIPYPILNAKLKGMRVGNIFLLTAGSGLGKSTFAHELGYNILNVHEKKLGCLALEENRKRLAERYLAIYLDRQIHVDRSGVSEEDLRKAYDNTINNRNFCLYDHRGSKDIQSLVAKIRYMVVGLGMEWIILDHISIVVSGLDELGESERKTIDKLMTALSTLVEELNFGMIAIVHLKRKSGGAKSYNEGGAISLTDLRGSGGLEQLTHVAIGIERNQQDEATKHFAKLRLLKDRDIGDTGEADVIQYFPETGRLLAAEHNPFEGKGDGPFNNEGGNYAF